MIGHEIGGRSAPAAPGLRLHHGLAHLAPLTSVAALLLGWLVRWAASLHHEGGAACVEAWPSHGEDHRCRPGGPARYRCPSSLTACVNGSTFGVVLALALGAADALTLPAASADGPSLGLALATDGEGADGALQQRAEPC